MASSPAFARIKRDVLQLVDSIPAGRFSTYELIGAAIDVPARHVVYILSHRSEEVRASHPVHRVVGKLSKLPAKPENLLQLMQSEGLRVEGQAVVNGDLCYTPKANVKAGRGYRLARDCARAQ